jgi:hypothetical protein
MWNPPKFCLWNPEISQNPVAFDAAGTAAFEGFAFAYDQIGIVEVRQRSVSVRVVRSGAVRDAGLGDLGWDVGT